MPNIYIYISIFIGMNYRDKNHSWRLFYKKVETSFLTAPSSVLEITGDHCAHPSFFFVRFIYCHSVVVSLICHFYNAKRRNELPRWYTICEEPQHWPQASERKPKYGLGCLAGWGPELHCSMHIPRRISVGWVVFGCTLDCVYNPLLLYG